ncbi:septum formation family protein [Klenkia taihuensis]|uniref:Septum formation n=1 Tax=Klenkia taihuensis TaxID=1225127 RepID=A0A1I1QZB1_9ACTN|nr:septum formation family protein [Klenkia taihuensis]GHE07380.1 hypothetical protein GCM10011381_03250 [Klenkia taihuensis]SFD27456.1 Septum formation [Klenkia taihuensis]
MRRALLAVGAVLVLAGCSSTVEGSASPAPVTTPTPGDDPMVDAPAVGTCHAVESAYDPLEVPEVVECGDGHTGETAAVLDTGLPVEAEYPTQDDLDEGYLGDAYDDVCSYDTADDYLRAQPGDRSYTNYTQVLPTPEQWARGARWVACDVTYGYSQPEPAPGRMAGALESGDTAAYRACLTGDPADDAVVPCSEPHWGEQISGYPDVPEGTPFPADRAARAVIAEQCRPAAVDYLDGPVPAEVGLDITTDDPEDWASYPFPSCVLIPVDGGTTTGSFRDS